MSGIIEARRPSARNLLATSTLPAAERIRTTLNFYDYAGQDPINRSDLAGTMTGGLGAPGCQYWHCGIDTGDVEACSATCVVAGVITIVGPGKLLKVARLPGLIGRAIEGLFASRKAVSVEETASAISDWLGPDAVRIVNKDGDLIYRSADNTRRVQFHFNNYYPHSGPHVHIDQFINGKWVKMRFPRGS